MTRTQRIQKQDIDSPPRRLEKVKPPTKKAVAGAFEREGRRRGYGRKPDCGCNPNALCAWHQDLKLADDIAREEDREPVGDLDSDPRES